MEKFKEVLVCVIGATPQIITETIYALANKTPPVCIDEIFVITTATGKRQIENALIKNGVLEQLINEYGLPPVKINPSSIIVIKDKNGNEIEDIRNEQDCEATADTIISLIKELTKDSSVRLHCSLTGGRKTMSFYLGSAMELFGRPWDKLYHVLVSQEFESNPEFFYKPKEEKLISYRKPNGVITRISTEQAKIEIAELPFIKLSGKIELQGKTFKELIEETQSEINLALTQPEIRLNIKERKLSIGKTSLCMNPVLVALYATFLNQKILCKKDKNCSGCHDCYISLLQIMEEPVVNEFARFYSKAYKPVELEVEEIKEKIKKEISPYTIRSYISKINSTISKALNDEAVVSSCKINSLRRYAATTYGVAVERKKIKIE